MALTSLRAKDLLNNQLGIWPQASENYAALDKVEVKEFMFDKFVLRVQFNPARIQSSAAKVDAKSISERKCFLCPKNLPEVQEGIPFDNDFQLLVNPFPIFPQHFTIPAYNHVDQLIEGHFGDMLDLAYSLNEFVIFYNGPKCGASAPDHLHFQAGNKGFLPIEQEVCNISKETILKQKDTMLYAIKDYLRNGFLILSSNKDVACRVFDNVYNSLDIKEGDKEPMMNILAWYKDGMWYTCIFPRKKHRPDCYFAEGEANILISLASVDLGGVFITPLEKDFAKIKAGDLRQILHEICVSDAKMKELINKIKDM